MKLPDENAYGHTKKLRFIIAVLQSEAARLGRPPNVVDFGCGNGSAISQYLIPHSNQFIGIDTHLASLDHARAHYSTPRAAFTQSFPDLEFPVDVIVYADVLEHLTDPGAVLRDHFHHLSVGGIIVGSVPNGYGLYEIESSFAKRLRLFHLVQLGVRLKRSLVGRTRPNSDLPYNHQSGHVQFFTRRALFDLHAAAGFSMELFRPGVFAGAPISERLFLRNKRIIAANASIAEKLPWWAVSTWLFTARRPKAPWGSGGRSLEPVAGPAGAPSSFDSGIFAKS